MRFEPWAYQSRAVEWVKTHPRCLLFLGLGLGKSVISLTAVQDLIDDCVVTKALVVAPKKVAESTWSAEASKWDHLSGLKVSKVMGTAKQRRAALMADADVYVIGRDSFGWLMGEIGSRDKWPFDMIIIDELTSFKSSKSQRFKAMRIASACARRVIGLTGTPAPNGLIDLWAQVYCVDLGKRLGKSLTRYRETYFDSKIWNNIVVKTWPKPGMADRINEKIADITLTMEASDYLSLPPIMVEDDMVDLGESLMAKYREFEREKVMEFAAEHEGESETVMANSAAGLMNKLSQFANGAVYDAEGNAVAVHGEKLERLAEIVEGACGESVLVFYQYRSDIPRIIETLGKDRVRIYEGDRDLRDWNDGKIPVLLAHPASTAYGLNMQQGGRHIVWFGTGWNLELYEQANGRLHRQGQTRPVMVRRLVCRGTVDEKAAAALSDKAGVQKHLLAALKELMEAHGVPRAGENANNKKGTGE